MYQFCIFEEYQIYNFSNANLDKDFTHLRVKKRKESKADASLRVLLYYAPTH